MAKKMSGMARKMMDTKGGKSMGTGGRTKNPADKKKSGAMQGPGGMKPGGTGGKVHSTTSNKKYC